MTIAQNLQEFSKEFEEIQAEFTGRARKMFTASLKELFEQNKELGQIRWAQYTPYFNDGDECVFSANDPDFIPLSLVQTEEADDYYGQEMEKDEDMRAVSRFITSNDTLMQSLYGDHVEVFVTRGDNGSIVVSVEEYEHD